MIKMILKFVFAFIIIYWLFQKGDLDFSLIPRSLGHPGNWIFFIGILLLNEIITSYRWRSILHLKTETKVSAVEVVKLTWIGMFFSAILPGAVTGDIIKMFYAKSLSNKLDKSFLLTSVFIDRLIGLIGLLFLMGIMSVIFYSELTAISPQVRHVIHLNFVIFAGVIAFLLTLFVPEKLQRIILRYSLFIPIVGNKIKKLLEQVWLIGNSKKTVAFCLFSAVFSQTLNVISFWVLAKPFFNNPLPWKYAFSFIPLGFVSIAIPIAPSGLGVGHAMFNALFSYFHIAGGASIFNLFFSEIYL